MNVPKFLKIQKPKNVKGCLGCLVQAIVGFFAIAFIVGIIEGIMGVAPSNDSASDAPATPVTGTIAYTVDTDGAAADDWSLYVSGIGDGDTKVSPAGGTLTANEGDYEIRLACDYWISSDGTLLQADTSAAKASIKNQDDSSNVAFKLHTVDPSATPADEYKSHIETACAYISGVEGSEKADELRQLATAILKNAPPYGSVTVHYLNVGQGDSELIQFPDGKNMLIDAGEENQGSTVISDLNSLGVTRIDWLVATHPHADHIGGMAAVINAFDIGEVWAPNATNNTDTFEAFATAVQNKGLSINAGSKGKSIVPSGDTSYSIDILGPSDSVSSDDLNDYSLIIQVKFGSTSFLFTGDAPKDEIRADVSGHVDVLKVAHHGSDTGTDTALMQQLTPTIAVISYGLDNSYGHPTQDTLDALSAVSAQVFGTGANGTVTVVSDGTTVTASPEHEGTVVAGGTSEAASTTADSTSSSAAAAESIPAATAETPAEEAAPAASSTQESAPAAEPTDETVYITNKGKKYHRDGCQYLNKSKIPISKSEAIAKHYTPCSKCNP